MGGSHLRLAATAWRSRRGGARASEHLAARLTGAGRLADACLFWIDRSLVDPDADFEIITNEQYERLRQAARESRADQYGQVLEGMVLAVGEEAMRPAPKSSRCTGPRFISLRT